MKLKQIDCVFIDCQSTGASPANGNVLEIAWCKSCAEREPELVHSFVIQQPEGKSIPFMIQNITGITDDELTDAALPENVYKSLLAEFTNSRHPAVIHYATFERAFLENWHQTITADGAELPFNILCTYQIARRIFPNFPTRGINGLAGFFGATISDTKRSACHVRSTWHIWRGLVDELGKIGIENVDQLSQWLSTVKPEKRGKIEYPLDKAKRAKLADKPGVYRMFDRAGNILYVGKATSLKSRVNSYFRGRAGKDAKRMEMLTRVHDLQLTECDTPLEAAIMESDEIKRLNPPFNVVLKTGRRQLIYYNRDLTQWSPQIDLHYSIGPFSSPFWTEPLLRLSTSLTTGEFDPEIFFEYIDPELLREGFACLKDSLNLSESCISPRSLMAFAVHHYKRLVARLRAARAMEAALLETTAPESDGHYPSGDGDVDDDMELEEDAELTPEEIAGKFERMLLRAGKAYLQARVISSLCNSSIEFEDGGIAKKLAVKQGRIRTSPVDSDSMMQSVQGSENGESGFVMDLSTFDRLRVLLSELGRVSANGPPVKIEVQGAPAVPAWLVSRSAI
jgi:DNA polymerase-3 subunit epsilon